MGGLKRNHIEKTDALTVRRPMTVQAVTYKLKPGESFYKDRYTGRTYIIKNRNELLRQDNRTSYQLKMDKKASDNKRRQYALDQLTAEGMKGILAMAKLISPSTYIGAALLDNGKSYIDNVMSGEGTGDEVANIGIDVLTPFALGKLQNKAVTILGKKVNPALTASSYDPLWKLDTEAGIWDVKDYLYSNDWIKRAKKVFDPSEALFLRDWLIRNLNNKTLIHISKLPESATVDGTSGLTIIRRALPQNNLKWVDLQVAPNLSPELVRSSASHEALHASTLMQEPRSKNYANVSEYALNLLRKQMLNAEKLADNLQIDPEGEQRFYDQLVSGGYSPEDAWGTIWQSEAYLKDPQEARAFGVNENIYNWTKGKGGEPIPKEYKLLFTKESMDKLLKGIFTTSPVLIGIQSNK